MTHADNKNVPKERDIYVTAGIILRKILEVNESINLSHFFAQ
jgi:hypothetical protein